MTPPAVLARPHRAVVLVRLRQTLLRHGSGVRTLPSQSLPCAGVTAYAFLQRAPDGTGRRAPGPTVPGERAVLANTRALSAAKPFKFITPSRSVTAAGRIPATQPTPPARCTVRDAAQAAANIRAGPGRAGAEGWVAEFSQQSGQTETRQEYLHAVASLASHLSQTRPASLSGIYRIL